MKFDNILNHVGAFGTYQRRIYFVMTLVAIPSALHTFSPVFLSAKTDHWCTVPELAPYRGNCTALYPSGTPDQCSAFLKNISIPREVDDSGKVSYAQCRRFNLTGLDVVGNSSLLLAQPPIVVGDDDEVGEVVDEVGEGGPAYNQSQGVAQDSVQVIPCDAGWGYDTSQYSSTTNHQYELVCDKAGLTKYAQSAYFAGMLIGSFLIGLMADWVGRKPTFFICLITSFLAGIAQAFAPNMAVFIVVRFFVAIFKTGVYMMAFIIGTEFVGPNIRAFAGQFINIYYAMGYMLLAPFAYLIRDWQMLQVALTMTFAPFILLLPFLPESARWLMSRGRTADAEKILRKMAKVNKVELPAELFEEDKDQEEKLKDTTTRRYTYLDLFRSTNMRCKTINILFCWFVNNMVYYGISLSTSDLGVDHYIAAFVSGAVEIPAYTCAILSMQYLGRRLPLCVYLVASGAACIGATLFSAGAGRATVAMIGKFFITATFGMIYTYSAEIYPTPVRSQGMGLSSMMARISGILCPFILDLSSVWFSLPYFIFGAFAVSSGLLILLLPETRGKPLPESLEDAEKVGKGETCLCLRKCRHGADAGDINMDKEPYESLPKEEPQNQDGGRDMATEKV
ncbi:organic cation transporter protein-like [Patiria miniata]|uniref:Major facilitator superfamily (MFS) profile domain-containing protein n=1 Tax=Patiria miniata TaxID=46514 RepID=A0A914BTN5_PATMI|nr:organic cation transporter protein-like [Patiria miniata]